MFLGQGTKILYSVWYSHPPTHTHTHTHTHVYEVPKVVKLIEMESRRMVVKSWGRGNRELFNGYSFSFTRKRKFWRLAAQQYACSAAELYT